jgi:hypothetical protein
MCQNLHRKNRTIFSCESNSYELYLNSYELDRCACVSTQVPCSSDAVACSAARPADRILHTLTAYSTRCAPDRDVSCAAQIAYRAARPADARARIAEPVAHPADGCARGPCDLARGSDLKDRLDQSRALIPCGRAPFAAEMFEMVKQLHEALTSHPTG